MGRLSDQALYRKYRSREFSAVIGQQHIVTTLVTGIKNGRVSHAYLFTGPRGVGKTTVARLLARSLNCTGATKPCGKCANCQVELGSHLDLIEIDAASNRRIDEIRDLRDKIGLAPALGKYKVYIIDEVHMLTTEAFNALLKTLEEPPAHAVFILATTEAHKLPETIISRTQRFNFKPLNESELRQGLEQIAAAEKLTVTPAAFDLLARAGRGSMRDAISLLDQVSTSSQKIDEEATRRILGWTAAETIDAISLGILVAKPAQALEQLDSALSAGTDAAQIAAQLVERWRGLLLGLVKGLNPADPVMQAAQAFPVEKIIATIDRFALVERSPWPQLALETALASMAQPSGLASPPRPPAKPATEPQPPSAAKTTAAPANIEAKPDQNQRWLKALSDIKQRNNSLYALLRSCRIGFGDSDLILTCRFSFHRDRIMEAKNRQVIEDALQKAFGKPFKVSCQLESQSPAPSDPGTELVSSALEILGGEVMDG